MKKFAIVVSALVVYVLTANAQNQGHFYVGGTGLIGFNGNFEFAMEPVFGYEIKDWVAIGSGIGMIVAANDLGSGVAGVVEPFVRFTPWHNDLVFLDLKTVAALGFTNQLLTAQIGVRPSIRFRLTPHCDIAADLGLFGASYNGYWEPSFGVSGTSVGLWAVYRF